MSTPSTSMPAAEGVSDLEVVRAALHDDYDVLEELGRGGMAVVYRARERMLEREVAIKVLPFTLAFDESFVERFLREARTSARLEHPHVIPIYRVGRSGRVIYFVMQLLRGQSLSDRLREHGPLPAAEARRVLLEAGSALGYAHRQGVVHRDIKPDNILLDEGGRCVVTDFGIARTTQDARLTATGMSVGTPRYMSPEQARARPVDGRSDLYSLGVVAYECLTGRTPFDGPDAISILMEHVTAPVPRPALATPEARALYTVVERLLAKTPEERFGDAEELIAVLNAAPASGSPERQATLVLPAAALDPLATPYADATRIPQSSAALDTLLETGVEWLREQQPRAQAVLSVGRRTVAQHAPLARRLLDSVSGGIVSASAYLQARWRRAVAIMAVGILLLAAGPIGAHYALEHRSRCGEVLSQSPEETQQTFVLLLDDAASIRQGGDVDVYYDVCGLPAGTGFNTRITISRIEPGLRRLLRNGGSVRPLVAQYEEAASGPAVRRHRSFDMAGMPGGGYYVSLVVVDEAGRRRELGTSFRVRGSQSDE